MSTSYLYKDKASACLRKRALLAIPVAGLLIGPGAATVAYGDGDPLVTISLTPSIAPNSVPDDAVMTSDGTTGYGVVPYEYRIGTTEVTNNQYVTFLNAVDSDGANALGLFNTTNSVYYGITWNGTSGEYEVKTDYGQKPMVFVSIYNAMRFTNWLTNGATAEASTETGVYNLLGGTATPENPKVGRDLTGLSGTVFAIASENEWYKAAYWKGTDNVGEDNYYTYAGSDDLDAVNANYNNDTGSASDLRDVAGGLISASGTFDQSGNVWEWNDMLVTTWNDTDLGELNVRGLRGGAFNYGGENSSSLWRSYSQRVEDGSRHIGFRVVSLTILAAVPEPGTYAAAMGLMILITGVWIRRGRRTR
ncbi:MAG: formylglycine-generating enzyme family protein [Opitutaceae bacterium]|jgi:formylglycine-generating enzyme required for sulfatase activity|nr:formylglycine-generating enzyme family protein [Opitutaceae bacterium]